MNTVRMSELLLQSLEHERSGEKLYQAAIRCALHDDLRLEWMLYLEQTREHAAALTEICEATGLNPLESSSGTRIVTATGAALVSAIEAAHASGNPRRAQIVAAECIVSAKTKDHLNWQLLATVARSCVGQQRELLTAACEKIEGQQDEYLFNTQAWVRELWLDSLGLASALRTESADQDLEAPENFLFSRDYLQSRH